MLRLTAAFTRSRWRRRTTSGAPLVSVVCSTVFPFLGAAVTRWCPGALDLYGSLHDLGSLRRHGSRVISGTPGPDGSLNLPGALDLLGCCAAGRRATRRYELLRADAPSEDAHRRLASHALADLLERVFDEAVGANDLVPENELSLLEPPAQAHRDAVRGTVDVDRNAEDELLRNLHRSFLRRAADHFIELELDLPVRQPHSGRELHSLLGLERERDLEQIRAVWFHDVGHVLFEEAGKIDLSELLAVAGHPRLELHAAARLERGGVATPARRLDLVVIQHCDELLLHRVEEDPRHGQFEVVHVRDERVGVVQVDRLLNPERAREKLLQIDNVVILRNHGEDARLLIHAGRARIAQRRASRNRGLRVAKLLRLLIAVAIVVRHLHDLLQLLRLLLDIDHAQREHLLLGIVPDEAVVLRGIEDRHAT